MSAVVAPAVGALVPTAESGKQRVHTKRKQREQRPGIQAVVLGSCWRALLFAAGVVLLACVGGLPFLAVVCLGGFLL